MRSFASGLAVAGLSLFFFAGAAHADIFHCVDRDGRSVFRDTPCPKGTRTYGVTYAPAEQPAPAPQGRSPEELAALSRIQELEIEVAQLRAWLQAAQAAAPQPLAAPAQEVVQEPVYAPAFPVIVVGGCTGRDCKPNRHPHHDGGDHHGDHHGDHDGNHNGDGRASVRTPRSNTPPG